MKRVLVRTGVPALVGLLAVGLAVYAIVSHGHRLRLALDRLGAWPVVLALAFGLVGIGCTFGIWREVLRGLGAEAPAAMSSRLFFTSQLGKYVPGSVWPVLAQMEFGRRSGISRRTMLAANVLTTVLNLAVGLFIAGLALPLSSRAALHRFWWTFLFLPLLVALLHPRAVPATIDWAFRRLGRPSLDERLPLRFTIRASGWALLSWLGLGAHVFAISYGLGAHSFSDFLAAFGGQALAVSAGVLFIPAPAGAGARDAVLVATLSPSIGATNALAVALVSRVVLIGVDLILALAVSPRRRADSGTPVGRHAA